MIQLKITAVPRKRPFLWAGILDVNDTTHIFLSVGAAQDPKWAVQPVNDLSRQLSDTNIRKVVTDVEIYSHLEHIDVALISFIRGLKKIYNKPPKQLTGARAAI